MNQPFTYEPLFLLLEKHDLTLDELVEQHIIGTSTAQMLADGQQVALSSLAKICLHFGCGFENVVAPDTSFDPHYRIEDGTQNYKPWTNSEDEQLIEEYNNGFMMADIARNLKRTKGAVSSRVKSLVLAGKLQHRENIQPGKVYKDHK